MNDQSLNLEHTEHRVGESVNQRQTSSNSEHVYQVFSLCLSLSRTERLDDSGVDFQADNTGRGKRMKYIEKN